MIGSFFFEGNVVWLEVSLFVPSYLLFLPFIFCRTLSLSPSLSPSLPPFSLFLSSEISDQASFPLRNASKYQLIYSPRGIFRYNLNLVQKREIADWRHNGGF